MLVLVPFTLLPFVRARRADLHENATKRSFSKTLSIVDIHRNKCFENAFHPCEHTKTEVLTNAPKFSNYFHKTETM